MKTIERILKSAPGVDAYRITESATQSYELFFVHKSLETVRATDTVATSVFKLLHVIFLAIGGLRSMVILSSNDMFEVRIIRGHMLWITMIFFEG